MMLFLMLVIGFCAGVLFVLIGAELVIRGYNFEDAAEICPPCNHKCNQGRNCPANK